MFDATNTIKKIEDKDMFRKGSLIVKGGLAHDTKCS